MTPAAGCVVLASGRSHRMGASKARLVLDGLTFLERALVATTGYPRVVVVAPELAAEAALTASDAVVAINREPERGMTQALRLGVAAFGEDLPEAIAVVLVDTPFVDAALLATVFAARGPADVAHPDRAGRSGHPVVFSRRALRELARLPDGDTLRALRDDPRLRRILVPIADDRPFRDVDTPDDFAALAAR